MASEVVPRESVTREPSEAAPSRPVVASPHGSQLIPIVALVAGCVLAAASYQTRWVDAYRLPRMHVVIDTTIGFVSLLLAYLVYGRAVVLGRQRDYVLAFA